MGEEVEELVKRLRERREVIFSEVGPLGLTKRGEADARLLAETADTIESLRASLTRVEEERDARPTIEEWSNEIDRVRDHWKAKLATVEKERDGMGGALVIAAERLRVAASRVDRADTEFGFRQWAEEAERASGLSRADGEKAING